MNCLAVRDQLAEQALGALPSSEATGVERHLAWCAACRREAEDLQRAAATFALTLAPSDPPDDLRDRVVDAVRSSAGGGSRPARRARSGGALVVAAMVAVSGLGWGAVMAGRAERFRERADEAIAQGNEASERFAGLIASPPFQDPENRVFMGTLSPTSGVGGGAAITLISPSIIDLAIVTVSGLPPARAAALPYTVTIADEAGNVLSVGKIKELDADGGARLARNFNRDLLGFTQVLVRDASGRIVMKGSVAPRAVVASPTP